mgnify:FL=1
MSMDIYLYIDVAMVLLALVEILRITLIIIENVKDTSSHTQWSTSVVALDSFRVSIVASSFSCT